MVVFSLCSVTKSVTLLPSFLKWKLNLIVNILDVRNFSWRSRSIWHFGRPPNKFTTSFIWKVFFCITIPCCPKPQSCLNRDRFFFENFKLFLCWIISRICDRLKVINNKLLTARNFAFQFINTFFRCCFLWVLLKHHKIILGEWWNEKTKGTIFYRIKWSSTFTRTFFWHTTYMTSISVPVHIISCPGIWPILICCMIISVFVIPSYFGFWSFKLILICLHNQNRNRYHQQDAWYYEDDGSDSKWISLFHSDFSIFLAICCHRYRSKTVKAFNSKFESFIRTWTQIYRS